MRLVRPGDPSAVRELVEALGRVGPTYTQSGATLSNELPAGFHHDRYRAVLGRGEPTFRRAARGLGSWQAHRQPGVRVLPEGTPIQAGATVLVTLGLNVVSIAAPCRIVAVLDEPSRWGFAYGTLPGHPEQGEESFLAWIGADETVTFEITAFSRPADPLVRLSGPIGRGLQRAGARGYLRALRRYVDRPDPD